jgi:hypothetical protein
MRKLSTAFVVLMIVSTVTAQQFNPGCPFPGQLRTLAHKQPIDSQCTIEGTGSPASKAQNRAKNNFCPTGRPVEVTISLLHSLETATETALTTAGIPFGSPTGIPPNRDRLRQGFDVGGKHFAEGMLVSIRAFVLDAHHSNVSNGENVNCNVTGRPANDIHIVLSSTAGGDPCNGVTAEISPHGRPDVWDGFDDFVFTHPVMFLGQLFYDASHKPCSAGHRVSPARIASWEIHPVYSIFVCKNVSPSACPASDMSKWTPFDQWVNQPDDLDISRGFGFLNIGLEKDRYLRRLLGSNPIQTE